MQSIQQVVFTADTEGRWTFLNPAWTTITGFNVEESLGTPIWDYVHPGERAALRAGYEELIARRGAHEVQEYRWQTRSGAERRIEARLQAQLDSGGVVLGVSGMLTDVTDRRRTEEALHRRQKSSGG